MIAIKRGNGRLALGLVPVLEVFPRTPDSVRASGAARSVMARDDADPADARGDDAVVCRICGGRDHELVYAARERSGSRGRPDVSPYSCASHSGRSHGAILRCLGCGMVFMQPKLSPAELVREYSEVVDPVYLDNFPARLETFRRTLGRIRPHIGPGARVLEMGSYCGAFLRVASDAGLDVVGLEPSAWAVEQARRVTDATIVCGTLDDLPRELGPFDVVAAWDVVEHLADPKRELAKVNQALVAGGRFVFCTLMIDNWFPRLIGSRWPWFMDMHLFYFTRRTIEDLLHRTGFEVVDSWPYLHITTPEYLLRKLGTLGLPGADSASRVVAKTPWARAHVPVRLGDIQLFVARKIREAEPEAG
jgi:SAM-dependent methyltransferase